MANVAQTMTAQEALAIPSENLPSCRFADDDAAWAGDAWRVLREMVESGESAREACGSALIFSFVTAVSGERSTYRVEVAS